MSDRSVRWSGVVATLLLTATLGACGGGGSDELEATPATSASPSVDADGYTAEQREAIGRVDAFLAAAYGRGTRSIAETSKGLVTDEYRAELIKTNKEQIEDEGLKWLGPFSFEPSEVEIDGDRASVSGCLDLTAMFLVPRADKAAGAGSTNVGQVLPATYLFEKSGDAWLLSGYEDSEASC